MAQNPQNGGLPAKMAFFGHFSQKWAFLPIFPKNSPVATGLKTPKSRKKGLFPEKGLKVRDSGVPGRGFYINPSRRGPAVPRGPGAPRRHVAWSHSWPPRASRVLDMVVEIR